MSALYSNVAIRIVSLETDTINAPLFVNGPAVTDKIPKKPA
jgi:hypothetical protein